MDEIEKLKKENEQLRKDNEAKSDIISITAHQLRTSLSAIKWIFKMFMDQDMGKLTYEQNSFVQKAYNSSERMLALINNLLTLNHTENASLTYNFKDVDLLHLLGQILFEFYGETNQKKVELIFIEPESILSPVYCDEEMIRVVFQNLIENAIKYSNESGKIFVSLKQKENEIEVSIRDTGIGIREEDKNNIFNKFFRTQNAIEKDHIGSGLGLFTTKNIVEKHNGKIWFENQQGEGTTFFVSLPIKH